MRGHTILLSLRSHSKAASNAHKPIKHHEIDLCEMKQKEN